MSRSRALLLLGVAVVAAGALGAVVWRVRLSGEPEARVLGGSELLANLRGYLKVGRVAEAAQVLASIEGSGATDCVDQARYEVARAYVASGCGELAIGLLDKISLHDRSFDFQRAILREKIRGLYSFFFDPSGDLRTPAQLEAYVLHSRLNPDEKLRPRNPVGFDDPNKLIDYFEKVAKQLEDVLGIQGLGRAKEPALAEGYDAIQILLYGRGDLDYGKLQANLASSPTATSARTLYLLGSQHFAEADYDRAFAVWSELLARHPDSPEALRAFEKAFDLFEGRRVLGGAFAFWPMARPAWLPQFAAREPFKSRAAEVTGRIESHRDVSGYRQEVKIAPPHYDALKRRDIFKNTADVIESADVVESPVIDSEPEANKVILTRNHSLGWRLQTEFREFHIRRLDQRVLAPSEPKRIELRTSYYGEVRFSARRFPDGRAYEQFRTLPPAAAVAAASGLPEAKSWVVDLGPMSRNGTNCALTVEVPVTDQGFYLITARARYVPVVAATQMAVVADKVLTWSSPTGVLYRAVDRETGAPVRGARIHGRIEPAFLLPRVAPQFHDGSRGPEFLRGLGQGFYSGKRDELINDHNDFLAGFAAGLKLRAKFDFGPQPFEVRTDADGLARVAVPGKWGGESCRVRAELGELGGVCPIDSECRQPGAESEWRSLFYAERPIFMPGEKARIKGILRRIGPGGLSLPERRETEFMLWHHGQLVGVMRATPSEVGTVALEAALPASAPLGSYHVTIGHTGGSYPVFKVDRFEMPLLDVRVGTDAEAVFAGSSARGQVRVHHAGLVPAVGVPVVVTVYAGSAPQPEKPSDPREDFFEPVRLVDYPETPRQDLLRGEVGGLKEVWEAKGVTAADGSFPFSFDTDRGEARRYVIIARVRALADRWESARAELLSSRLPVFLAVEPERTHYYPGETLRALVRTRGLDGRPLAAGLRLFVTAPAPDGREVSSIEDFRTDAKGEARIAVPLGTRAPAVEVGIQTGDEWARQPVAFNLRQIGASIGDSGLGVKVDRKAYYPGERAKVTVEVDRPGAEVFVTISREDVLRTIRTVVTGSSGTFDLPLGEADAPNVYLHAVAVWGDRVRKAELMLPVIPAHRFLKVEVLTDRDDYAGGDAVGATVRVTDSRGAPVRNVEVSLAAVKSPVFAVQEDLTPDLARYFLNYVRPLLVGLGSSTLAADSPRSECYWLRPAFAWGIYDDLVGHVEGSGLAGRFGFSDGGGRRKAVGRYGGSSATESAARELFVEFLRQHGLTLFWESRLVTDEKGEARAEFLVPPDGGEFRFTARAVSAETFVGELRKSVRYRRELIVQAPWPPSIREGELLRMPAFVINGSASRRRGKLTLQSDLPARLLAKTSEVELAPGGVERVDLEIDARRLPERLPGEGAGWQPSAGFARFSLGCEALDGRKAESRAVVNVRRTGIPVERQAVAVARRGEGPGTVVIDLGKAVPGSVRLEVLPLAGPERWIQWFRTRMSQAGPDDGAACAWAAEAGAERLAEADLRSGRTLSVGRELMKAFSGGVYDAPEKRGAAYFLACASAAARGVSIPPAWPEAAFQTRCTQLDQISEPEALWGLAAFAVQKPDRLPQAEKIAARLEALRVAGVESAADWAYLGLAFSTVGRPTKASWCLDKGAFTAGLGGPESRGRPGVEDAAALLLAGARLQLDSRSLGRIYAAVLEAVAANPRAGAWPSAVAIHALTEWGRLAGAPELPVKVSIGSEDCALAAGQSLVRTPPAGRRIEVSVAEPSGGAVGVQVLCSYRVLHSDVGSSDPWRIERRFARVTPDGYAELLEPGGALRLGDALLMVVHTRAPGGGPVAAVPLAGPWPAASPVGKMPLTRRIRRQFVLSPPRRARVLAAAEAGRMDEVRAELIAAVDAGDFIVETVPVESELQSSGDARPSGAEDPALFPAGRSAALIFRPDRIGAFVAPAAWLAAEDGGHPRAAAEPFPFRVLGAEEELPPRQAELLVADWMRRPVREALRLTSDAYLARYLERSRSQIDARRLAMEGLLRSDSARAPALFAQLAWGKDGLGLDELASLADWRKGILVEDAFSRSGADAPGRGVLARALSSDELLSRVASAPEFRAEPLRAYDQAAAMLAIENECRRVLYGAASASPVSDGVELRSFRAAEILAHLPAERVDALLDCWDGQLSGAMNTAREPSLRKAISGWAGRFGLKVSFAADVPDLESGEYLLFLPVRGSVSTLDSSLRSMSLRARRTGRSVQVWLDRNLARGPGGEVMVSGARSAQERLRVFMENYAPGEAGLAQLLASVTDEAAAEGSRYTPRLEKPRFWGLDVLKDIKLDPRQPLGSQLHLLTAQGLRVETRSGVLRIVPVQ